MRSYHISPKLNDLEFLETLVMSGKSLSYIAKILHTGELFILRKLQKFGLADKSLTLEDCKVPGWGTKMKKMMEMFPYEMYIERHKKNGETLLSISKELNFNYNSFKYVIDKYKNRYRKEQTGASI